MPTSPDQGSAGGGTRRHVTGTGLIGATAVTFGAEPGTVTANTATSPSGRARAPGAPR
jgi:hypothetical protein